MYDEFRLPDGMTVTERLLALRTYGNKTFTRGLHPGVENILGLRVPDVRALAREIARQCDWQTYLDTAGTFYMEERMLHGLVLGQIQVDDTAIYLDRVREFVGRINSWSVCDTFSFAGGSRFVNANREKVLSMLIECLKSGHEYTVRFGVVMLMQYFTTPENAMWFMDIMESVRHEGYYVRMAVAWAVSTAFIKAPETMLARLDHSALDTWTHNKAISKIIESYRVTSAHKTAVRLLRRK